MKKKNKKKEKGIVKNTKKGMKKEHFANNE